MLREEYENPFNLIKKKLLKVMEVVQVSLPEISVNLVTFRSHCIV